VFSSNSQGQDRVSLRGVCPPSPSTPYPSGGGAEMEGLIRSSGLGYAVSSYIIRIYSRSNSKTVVADRFKYYRLHCFYLVFHFSTT